MELRWAAPEDGGCPISSYSILSDKGVVEDGYIHNLEAVSIEDQPYKFEHIFTFSENEKGLQLRFVLVAENEMGSS